MNREPVASRQPRSAVSKMIWATRPGHCPRSAELRFGKVRRESPVRADSEIGAPLSAIDGIIHAAVFFNERFHARVARQPVLRAVVRTGILHDVLELDTLLVGDGSDTKFEPA
jgi:hypothetical protein